MQVPLIYTNNTNFTSQHHSHAANMVKEHLQHSLQLYQQQQCCLTKTGTLAKLDLNIGTFRLPTVFTILKTFQKHSASNNLYYTYVTF